MSSAAQFCAKGCLLLCLHSPLVIPADAEDLLLYVSNDEIYPAPQHHIVTPPLPPRLSANEVRKRLLASFLPHGRRYCIYPRRPACLLHCLLHTPPHKSPNHRIIIHQHHHQYQPLSTRHIGNLRCFARTHTDGDILIIRNEHCIAFI